MEMTKQAARQVASELMGWADIRVYDDQYGDWHITAIDPVSKRRMEYDPSTGFFR
jgi:hypothetical protein